MKLFILSLAVLVATCSAVFIGGGAGLSPSLVIPQPQRVNLVSFVPQPSQVNVVKVLQPQPPINVVKVIPQKPKVNVINVLQPQQSVNVVKVIPQRPKVNVIHVQQPQPPINIVKVHQPLVRQVNLITDQPAYRFNTVFQGADIYGKVK